MDIKDIKNMSVNEVMSHNPITVDSTTTVDHVLDLMQKHLIHHIPVVDDDGRLLGIISNADLDMLLHWGTKFNLKNSTEINDKILKSTLAIEICQLHVMALNPENTLSECFEIFRQNMYRCLPVIDDEGIVIGIITPYDIMKIIF